MTIEDAVPQGAMAGSPLPTPVAAGASAAAQPVAPVATASNVGTVEGTGTSAPRLTGEFPNLNRVPTPAADQISRDELKTDTAYLRNAASRQKEFAGTPTVTSKDEDELRKLGRTHGAQVLKEIEGD